MPKSVWASSVRPAPIKPIRPTTSPARTVRFTSEYSPWRVRPEVSTTTGAGPTSRAVTAWSNRLPVINSVNRDCVMPAASNTPTSRPSRRTVTRLDTSRTSASRWLTKTTATPDADSVRTTVSRWSVSACVSEAVGSSMKMSFASIASARAIATNCRPDIGNLFSRAPRSSSTPSLVSAARAVSRMAR